MSQPDEYDKANLEPVLVEKSANTEIYLQPPSALVPQRQVVISKKLTSDVVVWIVWSIITALVLGVASLTRDDLFTVGGYKFALQIFPLVTWGVGYCLIALFMTLAWITRRALPLRIGLSLQVFIYFMWGLSIGVHLFGPYEKNAFATPFQFWTTVVIASLYLRRSFYTKTIEDGR